MSIRIMSQVWHEERLKGGRLLVMLALADFADDSGYCYPSMATIGAKCRMTDRAARTHVRELETDGFLRLVQSSGRTSNSYQIVLNPEQGSLFNPEKPSRKKLPSSPSNPEDLRIQPGSTLPPNRQEPSFKRESNDSHPFLEFWSAYPKREAKKGAALKFAAAVKSGVSPQHLIEAAQRYAAWVRDNQIEARFVKQPTTWLNQGCWDDELQPRVNGKGKADDRFARILSMADRLDGRSESDGAVGRSSDQQPSQPLLPARHGGGGG